MALRRALHRNGLRYRLNSRLPGRPDVVFTRARVAVFVDGDYWHGNAWSTRGFSDFESYYGRGKNGSFWLEKIRRNVERDRTVSQLLVSDGWTVVRIWESAITNDVAAAVEAVVSALRRADGTTCTIGRAA
jgi:DNA mismatch endonuclease (patch repair protein)